MNKELAEYNYYDMMRELEVMVIPATGSELEVDVK